MNAEKSKEYYEKQIIRASLLQRREMVSARHAEEAAASVLSFLKSLLPAPPAIVSGYKAMHGELPIDGIANYLTDSNYTYCLPCAVKKDHPLDFRMWKPGEPLEREMFGALRPLEQAEEALPDIILMPLLGFSRSRFRLGYGCGYYDRTLPLLRDANPKLKVYGLAYAMQEDNTFPIEAHDAPMDAVITEKEIIW